MNGCLSFFFSSIIYSLLHQDCNAKIVFIYCLYLSQMIHLKKKKKSRMMVEPVFFWPLLIGTANSLN